jgi:hypothetical protein
MRITRLFCISMLSVVFACGGGGSGGGGNPDAPPGGVDAPASVDAPSTAQKDIGSACVPDQANPQGDCPSGFVCLSLQGGTGPWCSKPCTAGAGDMCGVGYTGTGKAACFLGITPAGGGTPQTFCGVVCDDQTTGDMICPATQCDGTCPGTLACTSELKDQQMTVVAKGCQ